jgi:hypothetical protein
MLHEGLNWKASHAPCLESTEKRPDLSDASPAQLERHMGARRLVGATAVEYDFAVAWEVQMTLRQLVWRHLNGAGNPDRVDLEIYFMTQVGNEDLLATSDSVHEL